MSSVADEVEVEGVLKAEFTVIEAALDDRDVTGMQALSVTLQVIE